MRRELPGLRGISATNMKNMRKFYENWIILDSNPAVTIAELQSEDYIAMVSISAFSSMVYLEFHVVSVQWMACIVGVMLISPINWNSVQMQTFVGLYQMLSSSAPLPENYASECIRLIVSFICPIAIRYPLGE